MQLLTAGNHVQDVKVQELIALRPAVRRVAPEQPQVSAAFNASPNTFLPFHASLPAGGQVVSHLTLAVFAEVGVVFRTGGRTVLKLLPLARLGHSWKKQETFGL